MNQEHPKKLAICSIAYSTANYFPPHKIFTQATTTNRNPSKRTCFSLARENFLGAQRYTTKSPSGNQCSATENRQRVTNLPPKRDLPKVTSCHPNDMPNSSNNSKDFNKHQTLTLSYDSSTSQNWAFDEQSDKGEDLELQVSKNLRRFSTPRLHRTTNKPGRANDR